MQHKLEKEVDLEVANHVEDKAVEKVTIPTCCLLFTGEIYLAKGHPE